MIKAAVLALELDLDPQLAAGYVLVCIVLLPLMVVGLEWWVSVLDRLWPSSQVDRLARPQFIHHHASVDVDTSLMLVGMEQRRAARGLSRYFHAVRRGGGVGPLRDAVRKLLADVMAFLDDVQRFRPMYAVDGQNVVRNRQKLLVWLEDALWDPVPDSAQSRSGRRRRSRDSMRR